MPSTVRVIRETKLERQFSELEANNVPLSLIRRQRMKQQGSSFSKERWFILLRHFRGTRHTFYFLYLNVVNILIIHLLVIAGNAED